MESWKNGESLLSIKFAEINIPFSMTTKFVSNVHSFHSFYFSQLREWFVFRVYPMRKRKKWLLTRVTIFTWLKRRRLFLDSWDSFPWPRWPPRTQHDEINSIDFFSPFSSSNGNTHCILVQNYHFFFFFLFFFSFLQRSGFSIAFESERSTPHLFSLSIAIIIFAESWAFSHRLIPYVLTSGKLDRPSNERNEKFRPPRRKSLNSTVINKKRVTEKKKKKKKKRKRKIVSKYTRTRIVREFLKEKNKIK